MKQANWKNARRLGGVLCLLGVLSLGGLLGTPRALAASSGSIALSPLTTTQVIGDQVDLSAQVLDANGAPVANPTVTFTVLSGPDAGLTGVGQPVSGSSGFALFIYTDTTAAGTDMVQATTSDQATGQTLTSNTVAVIWQDQSSIALSPLTTTAPFGLINADLTAQVVGPDGAPAINQSVTFKVLSGPQAGQSASAPTDSSGFALFILSDTTAPGTDVVQASVANAVTRQTLLSNTAQVIWVGLSVAGQNIQATEGATFSGTVATITDTTGNTPAAAISWGDGSSSAGTVTSTGNGVFSVSGSHTYAEEGAYTVTVSATDAAGSTGSATSAAQVADAPLSLLSFEFGRPAEGTISLKATFSDADPNAALSDYQATITWGDGATSQASIRVGSSGQMFIVTGSHRYAKTGSYSVTVTITDAGGAQVSKTQTVVLK